jgi:DNA repair exonuclease SbcCD ATPase subunit
MTRLQGDTHFFSSYMEAQVIKTFLPDLVTAISDCVQPVSDQCLAKGLIPESVYKRVLESGGTSEDKARTLVLAVKKSIETDSRCLEILLNILERELPFTIREKLLSEIRKEQVEKANTCRAVVPSSQTVQPMPSAELHVPREYTSLQSSLLGKLEDSIRQHERACAERGSLEAKLKIKSREHEVLKQEFEALKSQTQKASSVQSSLQSKIADCEQEIETLHAKVKKLEHTIEEQGMRVKRGRNTTMLKMEKMLAVVAQRSQAEAWEKAKEELKAKEREFTLTLQEMKVRIKELELDSMQHKKSSHSLNTVPSDMLKSMHIKELSETIVRSKKILSEWRKLGSQLGFTTEELDRIDYPTSKNRLLEMLGEWLRWYPGDSRGSTDFPSYTGLQNALVKAGFGQVIQYLTPYQRL